MIYSNNEHTIPITNTLNTIRMTSTSSNRHSYSSSSSFVVYFAYPFCPSISTIHLFQPLFLHTHFNHPSISTTVFAHPFQPSIYFNHPSISTIHLFQPSIHFNHPSISTTLFVHGNHPPSPSSPPLPSQSRKANCRAYMNALSPSTRPTDVRSVYPGANPLGNPLSPLHPPFTPFTSFNPH